MKRLAGIAAAGLLLAACSPAPSTPPAGTTSAPNTTPGAPHQVTYTIFGDATRLTYAGQAGNLITKTKAQNGIGTVYTATLLGGDTARIEAYGDEPNTGIGCSIIVDSEQVAKQTSYNAQAGVTCTYIVR